MASRPLLICGFGIIGLTSAIRLLQAGYRVVAVAEHLPGDPLTAIYVSTAAGAHHLSFAADDDLRQQALDKRTFEVMWEEEQLEGEASALMRLRQVEYYATEGETHIKFYESMPDVCTPPTFYLVVLPNYAYFFSFAFIQKMNSSRLLRILYHSLR